jgi:N-hydroxyarylamine O-acetyltransferase
MIVDVDRYLERIGLARPISFDAKGLETLQRAHLSTVPFENLHVAARLGVRTDVAWSYRKIVEQRRGGWCFELNGAFGALLRALDFDVRYVGAAVQLGGPNEVVAHLTLEVMLDEPWLVDVGFGESFCRPLALNRRGTQDGGIGQFEFVPSPRGTTLAQLIDGVAEAQYRFKRVALELTDFDAASERLQTDEDGHWVHKPFATRLLDYGPDRVTLLKDRLKFVRGGVTEEILVAANEWNETLVTWFSLGPAQGLGQHEG